MSQSYTKVKDYLLNKYNSFWNINKLQSNLNVILDWIYNHTLLEDKDRELIMIRYSNLITKVSKKYHTYSNYYTFAHLFTSISSLVVTSLISINNINNTSTMSDKMWWASWTLSLSISLVNLLSSFFKWERKYMLLFKIYTRLEQEIWMFIELIGPYANSNTSEPNSHQLQLSTFLVRLEGFYKRLNENLVNIEDTENKNTVNNTPANQTTMTPSHDTLTTQNTVANRRTMMQQFHNELATMTYTAPPPISPVMRTENQPPSPMLRNSDCDGSEGRIALGTVRVEIGPTSLPSQHTGTPTNTTRPVIIVDERSTTNQTQ